MVLGVTGRKESLEGQAEHWPSVFLWITQNHSLWRQEFTCWKGRRTDGCRKLLESFDQSCCAVSGRLGVLPLERGANWHCLKPNGHGIGRKWSSPLPDRLQQRRASPCYSW